MFYHRKELAQPVNVGTPDARFTHANMFMKALDAMGKLDDPMFGRIPPDETVKLVFNLSQGADERGPWNTAPAFEYVANPTPQGGTPLPPNNPSDERPDSLAPNGKAASPRRR